MERNEDDVYEVECILASRKTPTGRKYLVKWKGWPDDQNTWEPIENVDAKEEIKLYEDMRQSKFTIQLLSSVCVRTNDTILGWISKMDPNSKFAAS